MNLGEPYHISQVSHAMPYENIFPLLDLLLELQLTM